LTLQLDTGTEEIELNIITIILSQIPDILLGIYPIWYIYSKKHNFKKLSLIGGSKQSIKALLIGIIGAFALVSLDTLSSEIIQLLSNIEGVDFSEINSYLNEQSTILQNTEFIWILLLSFALTLSVISTEIVFRGVLHNTLNERFERNILGKITVIVIIALIYSSLFLLFTYPIFFIVNFLVFTALGIIYEINHNLLSTIYSNVIYNIILLVIIVYF
jgi:membrane protease YdiL (CAAX protease family)